MAMTEIKFTDVTEVVRQELNKVPGYNNRPSKKKLDRIKKIPAYFIREALENAHPDLLKELNTKGKSDFLFDGMAARNIEWLKTFNGKYGTYLASSEKTADPNIDKLIREQSSGEYSAYEFVLEAQEDIIPKLYGISIPAKYFNAEFNLQELFINIHFRVLPPEMTSGLFETDESLKPTQKNLRGKVTSSEYYPYGWDYLFFNLFTFFCTQDYSEPLNAHAQMTYQSALSGKNVISIFPVVNAMPDSNEKIFQEGILDNIIRGIGSFISTKIVKDRKDTEPAKNKSATAESEKYKVTRASISCNGLGITYMLNLFPKMVKLDYIKEVYLFNPPPNNNAHNQWVSLALAWAGNDASKYIRVYSQYYPDFNAWNKLIDNRSTIAAKAPWLVLKNPLFKNRTYTELNLNGSNETAALKQRDIESKIQNQLMLNSYIPNICYKHALSESGFLSQQDIAVIKKEADLFKKFDPRRVPPLVIREIVKYSAASHGTIAQIIFSYILEVLEMVPLYNGGLLGILFEKKPENLVSFIVDWAKTLQPKSIDVAGLAEPLETGAGGAAELYRIQDKTYQAIKLKKDSSTYFEPIAHELSHVSLESSRDYIVNDYRGTFFPGIKVSVSNKIAMGRFAFMSELLARRVEWLTINYRNNGVVSWMGNIQSKSIAKASYDFAVGNEPGRLSYYKQINYVTDMFPRAREKRILIGVWLQNFWTKDLILSNKTLDEIIKREFSFAGDFLINVSDAEFERVVPNGIH